MTVYYFLTVWVNLMCSIPSMSQRTPSPSLQKGRKKGMQYYNIDKSVLYRLILKKLLYYYESNKSQYRDRIMKYLKSNL